MEFTLATACIALAPADDPVTVADIVANGCSCIGLFGTTILPLIDASWLLIEAVKD